METNELNQVLDLRLGPVQEQLAVPATQSIREHRQIHHQRGIGEIEVAQVDENIGLSSESEHQSSPTKALGTPILVASA